MALSNKFGYLVLSTGNKSELAVGYCTLYGDLTGGFALLSDVYKTQVYQLTKYINRQREIIPNSIIKRPPTAELKPKQTDQDTLPPYRQLDQILKLHIEKRQSADEIINAGFPKSIVNKVINMIKKAEFKRKQAPFGPKVSTQAFGSGWRMPIAAK